MTHIARKDVPAVLLNAFPGYKGQSFKVDSRESLTLTDAFWDGGTRSTYVQVNLETGACSPANSAVSTPPQFGGVRSPVEAAIIPGYAIAEHSIFCGKDSGVTFHVHPSNIAPLLPAPADELPSHLQTALAITAMYISSARREYAKRAGIDYSQCVEELKARKLLNGMGALTLAGKNAAANCPKVY